MTNGKDNNTQATIKLGNVNMKNVYEFYYIGPVKDTKRSGSGD